MIRNLFTVCLLWVVSCVALSDEHYLWQDVPLHLMMSKNKETIVSFPEGVSMDEDIFKFGQAMLANQKLYFTPHMTLAKQRLLFKGSKSQKIYMLDVSTVTRKTDSMVHIKLPEDKSKHQEAPRQVQHIDLVRFAVQQFYGLKRLKTSHHNIHRLAMRLPSLLNLYPSEVLKFKPLAQWQADHLYVSAIKVMNQGAHDITIDVRQIRGQFVSATLFPNTVLQAKGMIKDETILFVVSHQPISHVVSELI